MRQLLGRDFLVLLWQGENGSSYETRVALGFLPDGEAIALPFPAGKIEVRRARESLGEALCEPIVLGAGESVVLDLSR